MIGTRRARARAIVHLASNQVETPEVKSWLFNDERGTWEHHAARALEDTAARALEAGMTTDQVNDEIATFLAYAACRVCMKDTESQKV